MSLTETRIYVGLNDAETLKQEHETDRYVSVLKNVCKCYRIPFSFSLAQGGYVHEDGRYTEEQTLVISLIDADSAVVNEIAADLCAFFHQESVLITEDEVRSYYVNRGF